MKKNQIIMIGVLICLMIGVLMPESFGILRIIVICAGFVVAILVMRKDEKRKRLEEDE